MADPIVLTSIGVVRGGRTRIFEDHWGGVVSRLVLDPSVVDPSATGGLSDFSHIEVVFHFHRETRVPRDATHPRGNPAWPQVGVLAGHSPVRPNHFGVSACALLEVAGLRVHRARARWVPAPKRAWRPAPRRLALGLAVVFLAAAAASGAVALSAEHHLGTARLSDHAIAEVLNAPDAVLLTSRVTAGGTATVVMSRRDRALVFTTAGLPALSAGRYYQLWLMGPAGDRPAGVLPAPDRGMTSLVIATGVTAGDWVGLTVEPAPPARHRTSKPILMLSLAA
jgi:tRNA (Thr-GGU) A37 N-methylase